MKAIIIPTLPRETTTSFGDVWVNMDWLKGSWLVRLCAQGVLVHFSGKQLHHTDDAGVYDLIGMIVFIV